MSEKKVRPVLVMIEWEDAQSMETGAWVDHPASNTYEAAIMFSVGFLLYEGKDGLIITHAWNEDQIAPRDQIPRGMIRKITRLKA